MKKKKSKKKSKTLKWKSKGLKGDKLQAFWNEFLLEDGQRVIQPGDMTRKEKRARKARTLDDKN